MSRRGIALPSALLIVLLGGALVATAAGWSVTEIRAGEAWSARNRAGQSAWSSMAAILPQLVFGTDSIAPGTTLTLEPPSGADSSSTITVTLLPDSVWQVEAVGRYRSASETAGLLVRIRSDSGGGWPIDFRPRVHPVP